MIKHLPLTLGLALIFTTASSQQFDLKDLVDFAGYNVTKFDAQLGRKDFKRDYNSPRETRTDYNYFQEKKIKGIGKVKRRFCFKESTLPSV